MARNRLTLDVTAVQWRQSLLAARPIEIPMDGTIAARSVALPNTHNDPADRIIIATTPEDHQLISDDHLIINQPGPLNRFPVLR